MSDALQASDMFGVFFCVKQKYSGCPKKKGGV